MVVLEVVLRLSLVGQQQMVRVVQETPHQHLHHKEITVALDKQAHLILAQAVAAGLI
jgi:hypothetical protein